MREKGKDCPDLRSYKAVVFDFDMTLADTAHVIADLLNETVRHFGYPGESFEYILPVVGNAHPVMLGHTAHESDPARLLEMQTYYRKLCGEQMPDRTTFFPGVGECLRAFAARGTLLGIVSTKLGCLLRASLDKYGFSQYFRSVLGGDEVKTPKPDPEGLLRMLSLLGVEKRDLLYVGDSLVDEKTAEAAGVDFCAMLLGGTKREQFTGACCKGAFSSWGELDSLLRPEAAGEASEGRPI